MQGHNDTDRPTVNLQTKMTSLVTNRLWLSYVKDLSGIVGASENNYFSAGGFSTVWLGYWSDPDRRPNGCSRGENVGAFDS